MDWVPQEADPEICMPEVYGGVQGWAGWSCEAARRLHPAPQRAPRLGWSFRVTSDRGGRESGH